MLNAAHQVCLLQSFVELLRGQFQTLPRTLNFHLHPQSPQPPHLLPHPHPYHRPSAFNPQRCSQDLLTSDYISIINNSPDRFVYQFDEETVKGRFRVALGSVRRRRRLSSTTDYRLLGKQSETTLQELWKADRHQRETREAAGARWDFYQ